MTVSVDFDGTITQTPNPGEDGFNKIRPHCKETMVMLNAMGVDFILLTGRKPEWVGEAIALCKEWELPVDVSTPNTKKITDYYIDDKCIYCREVDWNEIFDILYKELEK